eukprot:symbB.v1.2.019561.t1/scaffold1600.1/size109688/4
MGFFSFRLQPEEAVDQEASHVLMLRASAVIPEAQEGMGSKLAPDVPAEAPSMAEAPEVPEAPPEVPGEVPSAQEAEVTEE